MSVNLSTQNNSKTLFTDLLTEMNYNRRKRKQNVAYHDVHTTYNDIYVTLYDWT